MKVLLTLDYELFNGYKAGTARNSLITPTDELRKILNKHNFKATFFVDTCYLNRLAELKSQHPQLQEDYELIIEQLKTLKSEGHDIQLHLHPNWLRATYDGTQWHSNTDDYKLSDLEPQDAESLFLDGVNCLNTAIYGNMGGVKCFRAGAYCLQTYTAFAEIFKKYGILVDSSVNRYHKAISEKHEWCDYTRIPKQYSYRFDTDVTKEIKDGPFVEVSIPNYKISFIRYYLSKFKKKRIFAPTKKWGDGSGSNGGALDKGLTRVIKRIKARFAPRKLVASIDSTSGENLTKLFRFEKQKGGDYFLIMGHPKNFTPYSLAYFDMFLSSLSPNDKNEVVSSFAEYESNAHCNF